MVQLFKLLLVFSFLFSSVSAKENYKAEEIKKLIGRTIILGFDSFSLNTQLKNDIKQYNLGGVILFSKKYKTKKIKNIKNPTQLKALTSSIQNYSDYKMFISIDQEGGKVQRLNKNNGFTSYPSAKEIAKKPENEIKTIYSKLAAELKEYGFNLNFAPVVDLNINKDNYVINKLERSYSKDSKEVSKIAQIFIEEQKKNSIFSVLKHFPGHGSSKADSHKGFVDISNTWNKEELTPYKNLINKDKVDFIMTAHVFNKQLDKNYPATLSYNINTKLLRERLNFKGLIVSDDLQMKAISNHYTLKQTLELAINSGVNILVFGNQLGNTRLETIVNTTYELIKENKIPLSKILESNRLINNLLLTNSI
ncbi:glycosyl hydrolase [Arcobacter sp. CECT 8983]|uniref:glycoside hydrolase family 3 N-terminal domain-containing protein n=1 Tax=Arcobacter sp. CECT 8983 TaxID=2044508 RepID=UPI00100B6F34|nr:glycoside hydrolase family 3 N-terminal domain-containing protein [Arcobacter sp. CECT 8983]RXJ88984.1 glycosyl hydrolase [Arcobacter sp. CECT 8983]